MRGKRPIRSMQSQFYENALANVTRSGKGKSQSVEGAASRFWFALHRFGWCFRWLIRLTMASAPFRFLYSRIGEQMLRILTVSSIAALVWVLVLETQSGSPVSMHDVFLYDSVMLAFIAVETLCRTIRLEFVPGMSRAWTRMTFVGLSQDDLRRFAVMKVGLYYIDLALVVLIGFFLAGEIQADPITLSLIRLTRLVAILRAFDLPLMRDLTAILLAAFESVYLVCIAIGMHVFVYATTGTVWFGAEAPQYFGDLLTSATTLVSPVINKGSAPFVQEMCPVSKSDCLLRIVYFSSFLWIGGVILLGLLTRLVREKVEMFRRRS